jgi:hypothetical protein
MLGLRVCDGYGDQSLEQAEAGALPEQSRVQALGFIVCIFFLAREIGHGEIGHFVFLLHFTLKFVVRFGPLPFTLLVLLVLPVFSSRPSF